MSTWIPISERMPTREDADETGEVVWKWKDGTSLTAPFDDRDNSDDAPVAWLPIPRYPPPKPRTWEVTTDVGELRLATWQAPKLRLTVIELTPAVRAALEKEGLLP